MLYVLQILYVYIKRDHVIIQARSPWLLIICGSSLLIDSIINFVIQFLNQHLISQCVLGIITTASFFYIGWGTIALRAYRVKAVFDTYDGYLKALADNDNNKKD